MKGSFALFYLSEKHFARKNTHFTHVDIFFVCLCFFVCFFVLSFLGIFIQDYFTMDIFSSGGKKKNGTVNGFYCYVMVRVSSVYHRAPAGEHGPVEHINIDMKDR